MQSSSCSHRYDTPGVYYFTSGIVVENGDFKLAFGGRVVVSKRRDITEKVRILVKGSTYIL